MTTTVLNRLLLHLRRAELRAPPALDPALDTALDTARPPSGAPLAEWEAQAKAEACRRSRAISPFGLTPLLGKRFSGASVDSESLSADADVEGEGAFDAEREGAFDAVAAIERAHVYHYRKRAHDPSESAVSALGRDAVLTWCGSQCCSRGTERVAWIPLVAKYVCLTCGWTWSARRARSNTDARNLLLKLALREYAASHNTRKCRS